MTWRIKERLSRPLWAGLCLWLAELSKELPSSKLPAARWCGGSRSACQDHYGQIYVCDWQNCSRNCPAASLPEARWCGGSRSVGRDHYWRSYVHDWKDCPRNRPAASLPGARRWCGGSRSLMVELCPWLAGLSKESHSCMVACSQMLLQIIKQHPDPNRVLCIMAMKESPVSSVPWSQAMSRRTKEWLDHNGQGSFHHWHSYL